MVYRDANSRPQGLCKLGVLFAAHPSALPGAPLSLAYDPRVFLYSALVFPIPSSKFDWCQNVMITKAKVLMDSLQAPQNRAAKIVLDCPAYSSSLQALLDLKVETATKLWASRRKENDFFAIFSNFQLGGITRPNKKHFKLKMAQNSFQQFPRLRFWWVIITTL